MHHYQLCASDWCHFLHPSCHGKEVFLKLFVVVFIYFLIGSSLRAVTKEEVEVVPAFNVCSALMEIIEVKSSKS